MAISESERRDLFNGFEATHGEEFANTIMELLPNQPADQLVTRTDMHAFGTGLRGEMAELRAELSGDMAELRAELSGDMAGLRAELSGDMTSLRAEMIERFAVAKVETQRLIVAGMATNAIAVVAALLT